MLIKYKEVNEVLQELFLSIQSILENKLLGFYIGGSLAAGNFQYETSDIDCYIVTTTSLSESQLAKLEEMHRHIYLGNLPCAKKIEASYIPQQDLLNFDPNKTRPYFNEGSFYPGQYGHNYLIELYVLREKGIALQGPDLKNLIRKISKSDLISAIQKNLHEYWTPFLEDSEKLKRTDYQLFAIFTMCRTLYSLETGLVTSKIEAAQWAIKNTDKEWQVLIKQALNWKPGQEITQLKETRRFVKYTLSQALANE